MKKIKSALIVGALMVAGSNAYAQSNIGEWGYSGYISAVSIDSDTALSQGVGDSAYSIGFSADYLKGNWLTSLGMEIIIYDDNRAFTQVVEGSGLFNDGDISTESSDANGIVAYIGTGYQWRFGENKDVAFSLQGGFSHLFASDRSIESCSNCFSEDIDVDAGAYVKATLSRSTDSFSVGVHVQQFLGGDGLTNAFGVSIGSTF